MLFKSWEGSAHFFMVILSHQTEKIHQVLYLILMQLRSRITKVIESCEKKEKWWGRKGGKEWKKVRYSVENTLVEAPVALMDDDTTQQSNIWIEDRDRT